MIAIATMFDRDSGSRISQKNCIGPRAVDAGGVGELVRHGEEELPEQEGRGGRGNQRQDQPE